MVVTTYMDRMIVPCGFVWLTMLKFAVGPCQLVKGWLHGSWLLPPPELEGACGVNVGKAVGKAIAPGAVVASAPVPWVGKGGMVLVGRGMGLAVSVGRGVLVGMACCVRTTMVRAAA